MATATKRRSWLRPRYSLRVLLLAFTAFAIGFPILYRWPYEEVEGIGRNGSLRAERITTWQRQWGGGRIKQGPERSAMGNQTYKLVTYRNGQKNGPSEDYDFSIVGNGSTMSVVRSKEPSIAGRYADDKPDGVWTLVINGQKKSITYQHGKLISTPTIFQSPPAP